MQCTCIISVYLPLPSEAFHRTPFRVPVRSLERIFKYCLLFHVPKIESELFTLVFHINYGFNDWPIDSTYGKLNTIIVCICSYGIFIEEFMKYYYMYN